MTIADPFWARLQEENRDWVHKNFPNRNVHQPFLGLVEEFGEFEDATTAELKADALADVAIFAADACNAFHWSLPEIVAEAAAHHAKARLLAYGDRPRVPLIGTLGRFAHHLLKAEQGIRGNVTEHVQAMRAEMVHVFVILFGCAEVRGMDANAFRELVASTWTEVAKRVWTKPAEGGAA